VYVSGEESASRGRGIILGAGSLLDSLLNARMPNTVDTSGMKNDTLIVRKNVL